MKSYLPLLFAAALALNLSCGAADKATQTAESAPSQDPSVNKSGEVGGPASNGSMLVESSKDLPACNAEKKGALAYVKSEEKFYVCSGEWASVSIKGEKGEKGSSGPNGLGITKIQKMKEIKTSFCTEYSSIEWCYFGGGQVIRFGDGHIMATASWEYFVFATASSDSDTDISTKTMFIPKGQPIASTKLTTMVARGDGLKDVFLVYSSELDKFFLVYDVNESGTADGTDQVLSSITLEDI
jgi:hypothetical protein